MALILAQPLFMVELFQAVGAWLLTFKPFCRILGRDMNKLPCFLAAFAIGSCFCKASENDAYVCRLQSLTREFPIEVKETVSNSDVCMLEDFIFKTPSGEAVRIISSSQTLGDEEVSWRFEFEKDVKAVSVLAKTYSELQSVSVPVNMRIGFTGEIKSE